MTPRWAPDTVARSRRLLGWVGLLVGAGLLAAALATVIHRRDVIEAALEAARHPAPVQVAVLLVTVVLNIVLTALLFNVLISRYGRVGIVEMQALIAAASLLNFVPFRPGLFGRIAYHRAINDIPAAATFKVTLIGIGLSVALAGYLAAALAVSAHTPVPLWLLAGLPGPALAAAALRPAWRRVAAAALLRYLDLFVLAARYHAAFALMGTPIDHSVALAFGCLGLVVALVPFFGNGLGLREWVIGLAAPLLTPYVLELGLTADLVNRAAELLVVTGLGVIGIAWLARRRRTERHSI